LLNSGDHEDCWETGIVIFNQNCDKLGRFIKRYHDSWNNEETMESLWRPYDAQVIGYAAEKNFHNLCKSSCTNADAIKNSQFGQYFTHWINKENKDLLRDLNNKANIIVLEELTEPNNDDSHNIPLHSTQSEEPRET